MDGATLAAGSTLLILTYGRYHEPWLIATLGGAASALGSAVQLLVLRWALHSGQPWMRRFTPSRQKVEAALEKFPSASFLAIAVARATPLPDAPLKIVAAVVGYSVWLYALACFLGQAPYFFVLALIGNKFKLPAWVLLAGLGAVVLGVAIDWLRRRNREAA